MAVSAPVDGIGGSVGQLGRMGETVEGRGGAHGQKITAEPLPVGAGIPDVVDRGVVDPAQQQ